MHYENLDDLVRKAMLAELDHDIHLKKCFASSRLRDGTFPAWLELLREAITQYDDNWLTHQVNVQGLLRTHEQKRTPGGSTTLAIVPRNAAQVLAEGEFNKLYARGLCIVAIESSEDHLEVCRGKRVENPRPDSQRIIGSLIDPTQLLEDLRQASGFDNALKIPNGPNSGLTVRRYKSESV